MAEAGKEGSRMNLIDENKQALYEQMLRKDFDTFKAQQSFSVDINTWGSASLNTVINVIDGATVKWLPPVAVQQKPISTEVLAAAAVAGVVAKNPVIDRRKLFAWFKD